MLNKRRQSAVPCFHYGACGQGQNAWWLTHRSGWGTREGEEEDRREHDADRPRMQNPLQPKELSITHILQEDHEDHFAGATTKQHRHGLRLLLLVPNLRLPARRASRRWTMTMEYHLPGCFFIVQVLPCGFQPALRRQLRTTRLQQFSPQQ